MEYDIPTEGRIPLLDITIPIHWDSHAILMFGIWFVLVPAAILFLRFGKIKPSTYGIPRGSPKWSWPELCWTFHKYSLYAAILFAVLGAGFAVVLTGGFSGTLHAWFGLGTIAFGVLQIVSVSFRGSHGGRKDPSADPEDRSTWGGDHFDMAMQRWWFEAYHKTAGYFTILLAMGAVATGLAHFWMPVLAFALAGLVLVGLAMAVIMQGLGRHHDTYHSVYGTHPDHPFNKRRFQQMIDAKGQKP
jgi:hypothetical protein